MSTSITRVSNPDAQTVRPRFVFKRYPELYLYLLENKEKLKEDAPAYVPPPDDGQSDEDESNLEFTPVVNLDSDFEDDEDDGDGDNMSTSSPVPPPASIPCSQKSYLRTDAAPPKPVEPVLSKTDLLFRLDRLREHMRSAQIDTSHIPTYTQFSDIQSIKDTIEMEERRLTLANNVKNYKMWLCGFFMLVQFGLDRLGMPCPTYTQQQVLMMSTYEPLLEEISQKRYIKTSTNWGVEMRLGVAIVSNTLLIVCANMIMSRCSMDVLPLLQSFLGGGGVGFMPQATQAPQASPPSPVMEPPTI